MKTIMLFIFLSPAIANAASLVYGIGESRTNDKKQDSSSAYFSITKSISGVVDAEIGYIDFGLIDFGSNTRSATASYGALSLPFNLSKYIYVFGQVGAARWNTSSCCNETGVTIVTGGGVAFNISNGVGVKFSYQVFPKFGNDVSVENTATNGITLEHISASISLDL